jgi:hypothetical protein
MELAVCQSQVWVVRVIFIEQAQLFAEQRLDSRSKQISHTELLIKADCGSYYRTAE